MATSLKTYLLKPACRRLENGDTFDLITQVWQADRRWAIGERAANGSIYFRHRTYATLGEVCAVVGVKRSELRVSN